MASPLAKHFGITDEKADELEAQGFRFAKVTIPVANMLMAGSRDLAELERWAAVPLECHQDALIWGWVKTTFPLQAELPLLVCAKPLLVSALTALAQGHPIRPVLDEIAKRHEMESRCWGGILGHRA